MNSKLKILLSLPKTIWFNLYHLPFKQAIKLPVWIAYNSYIDVKGQIIIESYKVKPAMIRFGFHWVPICDYHSTSQITIMPKGKLVFKGEAHLGKGSKIHVDNGGKLILGDNFSISSCTQINCFKKIVFGRNIQFSWDCLIMDSDTHQIRGEEGNIINENKDIIFGDKIWIGCRTTILKGCRIPSNCVIGANTTVAGKNFEPNTIILGHPAKSIKRIYEWNL